MTGRDGAVKADGDQWVLEFERTLPHPIEKVWAALTEKEKIKEWLSEDATIELRVGGTVRMNDHEIDSTVVAYEPPNLLEFGWNGPYWDGGTVRWELSSSANETRLVLTHRMNAMSPEEAEAFKQRFPRELPEGWEPVSSTLAGWHTILDQLDAALGGSPKTLPMEHWRELNEHYKNVTTRS